MSLSFRTLAIPACFFGWLLSFPLYGPILNALYPSLIDPESIGLTFTLMHALGLAAGIFLNQRHWLLLMKIGIILSLPASIAFIFVGPFFTRPLCGVLGLFSALVVIGWSYLSSNVLISNRLRRMTLIILTANLFLTGATILVDRLSAPAILLIVNIPLAIAAVLIFTLKINSHLPSEERVKPGMPREIPFRKLLFYLCPAIFGLYLSGGFLYHGILPFYQSASLWKSFPEFVYILALIVIWKFGPKKDLIHMAYYSISLLGLGFITFMGHNRSAGLFVSTALIFSALAFLDVFLWTILGTIGEVCRKPFMVFGPGLTVNLLALYFGGIIVRQFSARFGHYLFLMSMVALAAMDLVILIIPLLNKVFLETIKIKLNVPAPTAPVTSAPKPGLEEVLPEMNLLTPKESEIMQYIIAGAANKEIAAQLHISENTLKVHMKNITRKFGVSGKYELLSYILNALSPNIAPGKDIQ
jgi:DNA-binding CsgD family transcriptional regulator